MGTPDAKHIKARKAKAFRTILEMHSKTDDVIK